jgi:hypothetical protein
MLGLAHGLALGRAEMRAQTPPDGFGNHPSFILVLLLRPGAKSLYSGPDSGPGSWLVAALEARGRAGLGALPLALALCRWPWRSAEGGETRVSETCKC